MAAATVTSHMATNAAASATGGGPNGGSDGSDVDDFVTTSNEELQVIGFNGGMRSVSTSPPPKLNCTPTTSISNVIENMAAKSLVVLMMDSSTQTEYNEGNEDNDAEVYEELIENEILAEKMQTINIDNNQNLDIINDIEVFTENPNTNVVNETENMIENYNSEISNENKCNVDIKNVCDVYKNDADDDADNYDDDNDVCVCEYEERIIEFDDFRIIEHVIDSRPLHKNRKKCREVANNIEIIDNRTNSCKIDNRSDYLTGFTFLNDKINNSFENSADSVNSCDKIENVDSAIDNDFDNNVSSYSDSEDIVENNPTRTVNVAKNVVYKQEEIDKKQSGTAVEHRVDKNNNTTTQRCEQIDGSIVRLTKITEQNLEQINKRLSEKTQQQKELNGIQQRSQTQSQQQKKSTKMKKNQQHSVQQRKQQQQPRNPIGECDTSTAITTMPFSPLVALKAFQSKLTPLAPPFLPNGSINSKTTTTTTTTVTTTSTTAISASTGTMTTSVAAGTSNSANTTAAMYAYERTTIFYQQQQQKQQMLLSKQQQQPQQQQQLWPQQYAQQHFSATTIQQHFQQQPQTTQQHIQKQQQAHTYKSQKKSSKQFHSKNNINTQKQQQQQQQQLVTQSQRQQQQQQVSLQIATTTATGAVAAASTSTALLQNPTTIGSTLPTLQHGQIFPVQFIPLLSPMPPTTLSFLLTQQQQKQLQQQQQGQGQSNANGGNNDRNKNVQQEQQSINVTTMATAGGAWPFVEAPIFIDANGEYCTYCPAHGTPLMAPPLPAAPPPQGALLPTPQVPPKLPAPLIQLGAQSLTTNQQQQQQHIKHIPMIGVTPSPQQQQQQQISNLACREGHNLLPGSSANNSIGTSPSGSPSPTPNPATLAATGPMPTAVPVYFKVESGVTPLPLQIASKSTVLRGK